MGSVPAKGTYFPSMAVRTWLQQCVREKVPGAVLFVDIRTAFYAMAPELAARHGTTVTDAVRRALAAELREAQSHLR